MKTPDPNFPDLPMEGTYRYFADAYDDLGQFVDQYSISYNPVLKEFGTIKKSSGPGK